jgi:Sulfatase-modifying factor enzyme 1
MRRGRKCFCGIRAEIFSPPLVSPKYFDIILFCTMKKSIEVTCRGKGPTAPLNNPGLQSGQNKEVNEQRPPNSYEVTQEQWEKVMGNSPSSWKGGNNDPVEQVSWEDVQEFVNRLNNQTGRNYRLPTKAEREYAARSGGKKEKYAGTSQEDKLQTISNY